MKKKSNRQRPNQKKPRVRKEILDLNLPIKFVYEKET